MEQIKCGNINVVVDGDTATFTGNGELPLSAAFEINKKIKRVVIAEGIESIGEYAFLC